MKKSLKKFLSDQMDKFNSFDDKKTEKDVGTFSFGYRLYI